PSAVFPIEGSTSSRQVSDRASSSSRCSAPRILKDPERDTNSHFAQTSRFAKSLPRRISGVFPMSALDCALKHGDRTSRFSGPLYRADVWPANPVVWAILSACLVFAPEKFFICSVDPTHTVQ